MIELYFLVFAVLVLCIIVYNMNVRNEELELQSTEAFENKYFLRACPTGYKSVNSNGESICCKGDMIGDKCISSDQCTMSGEGTTSVPSCISVVMKQYEEKGKSLCPDSMPHYYESADKKGCTNGSLSETMSGPAVDSQPKCMIYSTDELNATSMDSCANQKQLDDFKCFGKDCVKQLVQPNPKFPVLISVGFTDTAGMYHSAYTKESMERFLTASNPSWKDQGIDLSKSISVAEVAKAYYIDKTLSAADATL